MALGTECDGSLPVRREEGEGRKEAGCGKKGRKGK